MVVDKKNIKVKNEIIHTDGLNYYRTDWLGINDCWYMDLLDIKNSCIANEKYNEDKVLTIEFEYDSTTIIRDLYCAIGDALGFERDRFIHAAFDAQYFVLGIISNDSILHFVDEQFSVNFILELLKLNDELHVVLILNDQAGEVFNGKCRNDGYFLSIHSNEDCSHREPHIHVDYRHERSGAVSILTGEMLSGNLSRKNMKYIGDIIKKNEGYLKKYWNNNTNGIKIDLNTALGIAEKCW